MTQPRDNRESRTGLEIAVIGMSGRFPGADSIHEFWENLKNGVESIAFFTDPELEESGVNPETLEDPHFVKARGVLNNTEYFDAAFFNYTPQEAEVMDPQVRFFHECSWEALEDAGYAPESYNGRIGVYGGASSSYYWLALAQFSKTTALMGNIASATLYNKDFLCKRISYNFNLSGPSYSLYTACSTSLAAIDLACKGLLMGQCDIALAGGVSIKDPRKMGYQSGEGMIVSADGHNRSFDRNAGGTVFGNGAGAVVLKPLEEAEADGDFIYAVIKGSAVNNDGIGKSNFAAPGLDGQAKVIRAALRMSEVPLESIGYVETHGTATEVGDPIEIEGLKRAFNTDKKGFCAIGTVKSNMGHLDCAAGIAGFIKTVLALNHRLIPPSLHFEGSNPEINFADSPFYVNTGLKKWEGGKYPPRAGVSAFGIGGTNAHVILEEAPPPITSSTPGDRSSQLLLLSAKTGTALEQMSRNLADRLRKNPGINLADVAYTLQQGRTSFNCRRYLVCSTIDKAVAVLDSPASTPANMNTVSVRDDNRPVIFMFPGQGSQYVNMGRELYETEGVFRREMDRCFDILKPLLGTGIKEILYPSSPLNRSYKSNTSYSPGADNPEKINQTEMAQPLLFAFEYSLAKLLIDWGIVPRAMIGYSLGEYAAACISGVVSLEDTLKLIVTRGRLMQKLPAGAMLSVPLPGGELTPLLESDINPRHEVTLAIDNGPSCVVAGSPEAIAAFETHIKEKKLLCMPVPVAHAFHSKRMEPVLPEFVAALMEVPGNEPGIPYISNVTGTWITPAQTTDPIYWATHLKETVRFAAGLKELLKESNGIFIEVGPGRDLTALVGRSLGENSDRHALDLVRVENRKISDTYFLLNRLGQLWLHGIKPDWTAFYAEETRRRVPLPPYPFERQRYMIAGGILNKGAEIVSAAGGVQEKKSIAHWFYVPTWVRRELHFQEQPPCAGDKGERCLVFLDVQDNGIGALLVKRLEQQGHDVIQVKPGSYFTRNTPTEYAINTRQVTDYYRLFKEIARVEITSYRLVHLWGVTGPAVEEFEEIQYRGFYSLLFIARAIGKENINGQFRITVVSNGMQDVTGQEPLNPGKATVLGAVKAIPQEYPGIRCRSIDIELAAPGSREEETLADRLAEEMFSASRDTVAANRGGFRWVQTFEPIHLDKSRGNISSSKLKEQGVYLITGGLGKIGLVLADHLARKVKAKLILTGRSFIPPRLEWERWLAGHHDQDPVSVKIIQMKELEKAGAQVLAFSADSADEQQMQDVIARAEQEFGPINGVIHAAGLVKGLSFNLMQNLEPAHCREQFQPKVHGLVVLDSLFRDRELDFCRVVSSISTVLGGLKLGAYAAANSFMDAYVKKHNRVTRSKWMSVDWEGDEPEETRIGFDRSLSLERVDQLLFAREGNLQERIDRWVALESSQDDKSREEDNPSYIQPGRPRPNLLNPYIPPRKESEKTLVKIWQTLFGFEQVGIQDDFIELGGDSLKAVQIITRIHKELNVSISLLDFFKEPTIERIAEYITHADRETYQSLSSVEKKEYYPLSSAQKRLYILHQMNPAALAYNLGSTTLLEGEIDKDRFENSFLQLIERHEMLRTSYHLIGGQPVQRVHDINEVEFEIEYIEASARDEQIQAAITDGDTARELIRHFIRSFDLSKAPLLRVGVMAVESKKFILVVDMHHIIHDGVSQVTFMKEFGALYAGEGLPPLKNRYIDYSYWQNRSLPGDSLKKQEKYWLNEFRGEIPLLNLPGDHARPAVQSQEGSVLRFGIGREEANAIKDLALKEETTLFTVLLSIYITLLAKLSGQEDIVVGTPIAGRTHPDLQPIIGIFLNTLALRNFPAAGKPFDAFLRGVKERTLNAFDNQEYPFEDLVERSAAKRDLSRNPLFDVMFIWHNQWDVLPEETRVQNIGDLILKPYPYKKDTSEFDLTLVGNEFQERIEFKIEYATKLFKPETMQRFSNYFKEILASIRSDSAMPISELNIIPAEEKRQVLHEFNDTDREYPRSATIHELFARQAEEAPHHTTLVGRNSDENRVQHLTYGELEKKSRRLAQVLQAKEVQAGTIVAIMIERSVEMVVGLLGILRAGGTYLPLDPMHPPARISLVLKKSHTRMLLTSARVKHVWSALDFKGEIVEIHDIYDLDDKVEKPGPAIHAGKSTDSAYVIYTSGSTGSPKGVVIEHRNVVNFFTGMKRKIGFAAGKSILALTTISFDIAVLELLFPLATGMKVVLAGEAEQTDPLLLAKSVMKNNVWALQITPSHLKLALSIPGSEDFLERIDVLMVGGEALPQHLFEAVTGNFQGRIYNMYGPTETTVWSTVKDLTGKSAINIGGPIVNTRVYILNRDMELQPLGVPGELCIGGDGVSRGYLNNPELTAEKFGLFFNGFYRSYRSYRSYKSNKFYRTGDLARWLSDGEIEFMGRLDHQVKIRGFRIELEEIQEQLRDYNGITEAVVTAGTDENGDGYLSAYIVSREEVEISKLREFLLPRLPVYMIPSYFVQVERIPLTPNGKVDRGALPSPREQRAKLGTTYLPPVTELEKTIAEAWKEILSLEQVGIHDSFFDLGGNSLNIVQLNNRLKEKFQMDIPVVSMFRYFTITSFIKYLNETLNNNSQGRREEKVQRLDNLKLAAKTYKNSIRHFKKGVKNGTTQS